MFIVVLTSSLSALVGVIVSTIFVVKASKKKKDMFRNKSDKS